MTDVFDGIELIIDENWISAKLQTAVEKYDTGTAKINDKWISVEDGKPCLMVEVYYDTVINDTKETSADVYTFVFEN